MMPLKRFSQADLAEVKAKWELALPCDDSMFYEASRPYFEEAQRFCAEDHARSADGIYGLFDPQAPDELAIPGFTKIIHDKEKRDLRSVWNAWQPQLEENPPPVGFRAFVTHSYLTRIVDLAMSVDARSISIYAHNGILREWLTALVDIEPSNDFESTKRNDTLTFFGNWFRVGNVKKGKIF